MAELLVGRGMLGREELNTRQQQAAEMLLQVYVGKGMAVAMQESLKASTISRTAPSWEKNSVQRLEPETHSFTLGFFLPQLI